MFSIFLQNIHPECRKSSSGGEKPALVVWRMKVMIKILMMMIMMMMKAPEKKPLVRREAPDEVKAKIRKGNFLII